MSLALHLDQGDVAWAPRRQRSLAALVLLAHLCLLLGWHLELLPRVRGTQASSQQPPLVWLNLAATHSPPTLPGAAPQPPPARRAPLGPRTTAAAPEPAQTATQSSAGVELAPTASAIHVPAPDAPASAASAPPQRLMDTAATRAAIRQASRTPLWAERTASAIDQPFVSKADKQAEAVAKSAKGDCLKGEFDGAGMGLLSLPFFVVAEARGHCAR